MYIELVKEIFQMQSKPCSLYIQHRVRNMRLSFIFAQTVKNCVGQYHIRFVVSQKRNCIHAYIMFDRTTNVHIKIRHSTILSILLKTIGFNIISRRLCYKGLKES